MAKKLDKSYSLETGVVEFAFADKSVLSIDLNALSPEVRMRSALHGLSQKCGDAAASSETVKEAYEAVKGVIEQLIRGEWTSKREGTGGPRVGLLVEALSRCTGRSMEECLTAIENLSDDDKKALRQDGNIRKAIAAIRYEREQAKTEKAEGQVDLQALMGKGLASAAAADEDDDEE